MIRLYVGSQLVCFIILFQTGIIRGNKTLEINPVKAVLRRNNDHVFVIIISIYKELLCGELKALPSSPQVTGLKPDKILLWCFALIYF